MIDSTEPNSEAAPGWSLVGLSKAYKGGAFHLGPLDLDLGVGKTIGIIGANGAGKSTLFSLLTGQSSGTSGKVFFRGNLIGPHSWQMKRQIGYLPQESKLPPWSTPVELLTYVATLHGLEGIANRIAFSLNYWDCEGFADKPVGQCSHGMQKRVGLAVATMADPFALVLDEPFSGLDIYHARALSDMIQKRKAEGKLSILAAHETSFVVKLCDLVYALKDGQVRELKNWGEVSPAERVNLIEETFFGPTV